MASRINADNGVVSGVSGINYTGDNSGVMALQTNGNTAITIDSSQNVSLANNLTVTGNVTISGNSTTAGYINTPNTFGFKNRLINGGMVIDQRNAGASLTPVNDGYMLDRWKYNSSQASKFTVQQNAGSVTPPAGFSNYMGFTVTSAVTVGVTDNFMFSQRIEGFNFADMAWGTASASPITLSFWVRSSLTGTFGGSLQNSAENRSYPFTYSISSANTWEQKSVTIAGDTSGTWVGATNGVGLKAWFSLGMGSTYSGTAGAWAGATYFSATGATSVVGTNGATFYITGVQLEKGSTATSFDYRPYGTELSLCQRYYAKTFPQTVAPANGLGTNYFLGYSPNSANPVTIWKFPVTMRAAPTVTLFNDRSGGAAGQWTNNSSDSANARSLGTSTEFTMFDNSAVPLSSSNWWLGGATAAIEL